jgi:hypothetical protein
VSSAPADYWKWPDERWHRNAEEERRDDGGLFPTGEGAGAGGVLPVPPLRERGLMFIRVIILLAWSLAASLATAFAFAMSTDGRVNPATLALPGVSFVATVFGTVAGILLWPYMCLCLKKSNIVPTVFVLIVIAIVVVSSITAINPCFGLISSVIYWILSLQIVRYRYLK